MSKAPLGFGFNMSVALDTTLVADEHSRAEHIKFKRHKLYLPNFEHAASNRPPPYDPRALTESNCSPPIRDCAN